MRLFFLKDTSKNREIPIEENRGLPFYLFYYNFGKN